MADTREAPKRRTMGQTLASGSVLVVALFVMAVTSLLALSMTYRAALISRLARDAVIRARLRAQLDSALAVAQAVLAEDRNDFDHPAEPWGRLPDAAALALLPEWSAIAEGKAAEYEIVVGVEDELGKLNLQHASSQALESLGLSPEQIDSLFDWSDEDSLAQPAGAEDEYYRSQLHGYRCKNQPVESLDELLLVRGFAVQDLLAAPTDEGGAATAAAAGVTRCGDLGSYLTAWGAGGINLNTASLAVLRTLPISDSAIGQIVAYRAYNEDGSEPLEDHVFTSVQDIDQLQGLSRGDRESLRQVATFNSQYFRIHVICRHTQTGLRSSLVAHLLKDTDGIPRVLQWQAQP